VLIWGFGAVVATGALLIARAQAPGRHELELDLYILALGILALLVAVAWLHEVAAPEGRSELEQALDREFPEPPSIPELDRLERAVYVGAARAFDLHYRLRPVLREITATRLERRGLRLDSKSKAVRELLGDELWELTRPGREPPANRHGPGPGLGHLRGMVARLEEL
jgi:hypothetical protein